ncbi:hypothetical protein NDU88_005414 [Pleurodeles waltl]|uniref:Uncharacterized protein n=1 Tax=Pleurodeles waltl TaxID=8319 RepID=A0AAV7VJX1_PLEWA|nr:hypothetical protein NDU88_005414 [Pleurodeles waltl]
MSPLQLSSSDPGGKTPRSDAFPAKFHLAYTADIGQRLLEVYLKAKSTGVLCPTMMEGCITMILKPGVDHSDPNSYCPLTMINTAKRKVAITFLDRWDQWKSDVLEGAVTEEFRLWTVRTDDNTEADIQTWGTLIANFEARATSLMNDTLDKET